MIKLTDIAILPFWGCLAKVINKENSPTTDEVTIKGILPEII